MPSCRAGTYFFEIKKVCKKILPQGSGFLGNAKRKLKKLIGQFFICKIKNGGLDNEKRSEAPVASAIAAGFLVDSG